MKELFKKSMVLVISLVFLCFPMVTIADGMMMPPEEYWIQETGQKAVIMYEDGIETLVVSTSFEGDAEDFAWVIPVPNMPEISKASDELFTSLQSATNTSTYYERDFFALGDVSMNSTGSSVTIIETKNIDYYEATILTATDTADLATWFTENGYKFPTDADYILESYIQNGWYFVAMKINPNSLAYSDVEDELREGHATPVLLSFPTDYPVYPMKISSIISEKNTDEDTATYSTGKFGKAIKVNTANVQSNYNDTLTFDVSDQFNNQAGTLSIWVKPNYKYSYSSHIEAVTLYDEDNIPIFTFTIEHDNYDGNYMMMRAYTPDGTLRQWITETINYQSDVWQNMSLTWEEGELPRFFFQGNEMAIIDVFDVSRSNPTIENTPFSMQEIVGDNTLYLGETGNYAYVDEFKLFDSVLTDTQILSEYLATEPGVNEDVAGLTILGHFNETLNEEISGLSFEYTPGKATLGYYEETIPVLLYVLAEGRTELPGFSTNFANVIDKDSIKRLAVNETGAPLLNPVNKKLFLTEMSANLTYAQMTDDLFIRNSTTNKTIGKEIRLDKPITDSVFYIAIGISFLLSIVFGVGILMINRKPIK